MSRLLPPTYFLGSILLIVALHYLAPVWKFIPFPWSLLGIAPLALGCVLNMLADGAFKRHETTVKPFEESHALVTSGVFRFTRNPMYLGMTLILAGTAVLFGSLTPWIVVFAFAALMDRVFIGPEERMLEETFGDVFDEYRQRVRRWV